jgi:hypothetical protein
MIKVSILKQGVITNEGMIDTQEQAEAWVEQMRDINAFGRSAGVYRLEDLSVEEKLTIISQETHGEFLMATIPDQFTVQYQDISAELEIKAKIEKNLARMDFGRQIMAELAQRNQDRLTAAEMTLASVLSLEEKLAKVQRLLLNGSTGLALAELQALVITEISEQEKLYFVNKIQSYLASEG